MNSFIKTYHWLLPSLLFTILLLLIRVCFTSSPTFLFLIWNLFLAGIPLLLSHFIRKWKSRKAFSYWLCAGGWLLFFPNALYITTDLFHLYERPPVPRWFDLLLLLSAVANGALYGFVSLANMEEMLRRLVGRRAILPTVFSLLVLCGFGIYLGRYLRYNSWDIATNPMALGLDVAAHIRHPFRYVEAWALSGAFGAWSLLLYRAFRRARGVSE